MSLVISELESQIKPLFDTSFKFKKVNPGFLFSKKINADIEQRILITYGGYPDMYRVYPPTAAMTIHSIEKIINLIINSGNFTKVVNCVPTINLSCVGIENVNYDKFKNLMTNIQDFEEVKIEVIKLLNICANPFLQKYNSIENVADFLINVPFELRSNYIKGTEQYLKIPLIIKMAKHDQFHQILNEYYEYVKLQSQIYPVEHVKLSFIDVVKVFEILFRDDLKQIQVDI